MKVSYRIEVHEVRNVPSNVAPATTPLKIMFCVGKKTKETTEAIVEESGGRAEWPRGTRETRIDFDKVLDQGSGKFIPSMFDIKLMKGAETTA